MSFRLAILPFAIVLIGACEKKNKRSTNCTKPAPVEVFEDDPDGNIEVFLNSPIEADGPSSESNSPIGQALLLVIEGAEQSLDIAAYGLRDQPEILAALARAEQRGVLLRVVYDQDIHGKSYYPDTSLLAEIGQSRSDVRADRYAASILKPRKNNSFWPAPMGFKGPPQCVGYTIAEGRAVIAVHASRDPIEFVGDIMHHKFVVADRKKVWTGSCNLSNSGTGGYNANAAIVIQSEPVARWYTEEFERMYTEGLFHRRKTDRIRPHHRGLKVGVSTLLELGFSPQDYCFENIVEPALREARESIDVAIFFLTHKRAAGELIKAHRRGVKVRIIVDATGAKNGYTKHELLRVAGIPVKVESWGGKMHMKCALIDGKKLVLGSMNWTAAGESKNDENVILLDQPPFPRPPVRPNDCSRGLPQKQIPSSLNRTDPKWKLQWDLGFGPRPEEELYDLANNPLFPALRSGPTTAPGASPKSKFLAAIEFDVSAEDAVGAEEGGGLVCEGGVA